jgi:hypothetical protein
VDWAGDQREAVRLRGLLLGGLCNDFNTRGVEEHHGLTTHSEAGVRITLYFAVVSGAEAQRSSVVVAELDRAGRRAEPTSLQWIDDPSDLTRRARYRTPGAPERVGNRASKEQLACVRVDPQAQLLESAGRATDDAEWFATSSGVAPAGPAGPTRAASLSRFALALDLRGFDPRYKRAEYAGISELEARNQNAYVYRYLLRAWPHPAGGWFVEGGATHGLHTGGFGRDASQPTAHLLAADLTWWDGLSAAPVRAGMPQASAHRDPNLQPEDGFVRWAWTEPVPEEGPSCSLH